MGVAPDIGQGCRRNSESTSNSRLRYLCPFSPRLLALSTVVAQICIARANGLGAVGHLKFGEDIRNVIAYRRRRSLELLPLLPLRITEAAEPARQRRHPHDYHGCGPEQNGIECSGKAECGATRVVDRTYELRINAVISPVVCCAPAASSASMRQDAFGCFVLYIAQTALSPPKSGLICAIWVADF